ncbi:MAG: LysM peptidoglycan-binding domain-containing protein [Clostridia bacterium]
MKCCVYRIDKEKSLAEVSDKFATTTQLIMLKNGLVDDSIYCGMRIIVPQISGKTCIVKPFETLDDIAKKYNVTTSVIVGCNNLRTESVFIGQKLFIPQE